MPSTNAASDSPTSGASGPDELPPIPSGRDGSANSDAVPIASHGNGPLLSGLPRRSRASKKVVVWRADGGACSNLEEEGRRWEKNGWHVQRCAPRIVEGEVAGALLVLKRNYPSEAGPKRKGDRGSYVRTPRRWQPDRRNGSTLPDELSVR